MDLFIEVIRVPAPPVHPAKKRRRANFVVHVVNKALEAVPMDAGLLTTFNAFRTIMVQA